MRYNKNLQNVRISTRKKTSTFRKNGSNPFATSIPRSFDIPKVLEKVYKSVKKHKNKFLMVLPQWKRSAWYPQLIKSTRSPILILPKLSEGVFTNTERSVNEEKIPEWRVIALLIEDCDEMTSSAPTFLEILPEQKDFYREVTSCDIITSTTLQLDSGCNQHMIGNKNMPTRPPQERHKDSASRREHHREHSRWNRNSLP